MQRDGSSRKPAFSHGSNRTCPVLTQDLADSLDAVPPVTRPEPPLSGDERAMVTVWLDYQRATLEWKCEGLDGRDLVRREVPPSTLSLLGLVRHMTIVEWIVVTKKIHPLLAAQEAADTAEGAVSRGAL